MVAVDQIEQQGLGLDFRSPQRLLGDAMHGLAQDRSRYLATNLTADRITHSYAKFNYGLGLVIDQDGGVKLKLQADDFDPTLTPEERLEKMVEQLKLGEEHGVKIARAGIITFQALKQVRESEVEDFVHGSWEAMDAIISTGFPGYQFTPQI